MIDINDPNWPQAVPPSIICQDNEKDKLERASAILTYISEDLTDKKFLDFGCGEGHVVSLTQNSIGYDIIEKGELWGKTNLTTDFNKILGKYDIILLYDVLDHCQNPVETLLQVKQLCNENTKVYIRCHSWMSRHGAHLHKYINKAWIHLVLNEEELSSLNLKPEIVQKYYYPVNTHKNWFDETGFKITYSNIIKSPVDSFFKQFSDRLNIKGKFPEWQMSQDFNDYIIKI